MTNPIDLIEQGFFLACERHEETHKRWRQLHRRLESIRPNNTPHDAGDHDGRIDCLLREMEDDQVRYFKESGDRNAHPDSRTKLQIQLSRYWISSTYEMLRTTCQSVKGSKFYDIINKKKKTFGTFRIPIAKQEPQGVKEGTKIKGYNISEKNKNGTTTGEIVEIDEEYNNSGGYRIRPVIDIETGSIVFPSYDKTFHKIETKSRRILSDGLLDLMENLK